MPAKISIDPVTRVEGHLKVEVTFDGPLGNHRVVDTRVVGTLFRGFEELLAGRDPWDAPYITQRICGVCPIPHALAAVLALDQAAGQAVPPNGRILRQLLLAANFIHSHLLHFYHMALLDYISGPPRSPWMPEWNVDRRIDLKSQTDLWEHYRTALRMIQLAQAMGAVFGGKMPHSPAIIPGGFTAVPTSEQLRQFIQHATELLDFIKSVYLEDVECLAAAYPEYFNQGRGYGNLISFGLSEPAALGQSPLFQGGWVRDGNATVAPLDASVITEQVLHAWYEAAGHAAPASSQSVSVNPRTDGYSWIKAPRYQGLPSETGPLARMWIIGAYRRGVSIMDRHRARAMESRLMAEAALRWVQQIELGQPVCARYTTPTHAESAGLVEAPRGALGHWLRIENGKITRYQVISPTGWNCSPRDSTGQHGPMEQALLGMMVTDESQPIEVLRLIHSFDPCLACAVQ